MKWMNSWNLSEAATHLAKPQKQLIFLLFLQELIMYQAISINKLFNNATPLSHLYRVIIFNSECSCCSRCSNYLVKMTCVQLIVDRKPMTDKWHHITRAYKEHKMFITLHFNTEYMVLCWHKKKPKRESVYKNRSLWIRPPPGLCDVIGHDAAHHEVTWHRKENGRILTTCRLSMEAEFYSFYFPSWHIVQNCCI